MVFYSLDVIHSVFIKNLLIKLDVTKDDVLSLNLESFIRPVLNNLYLEIICFEYCGLHHDKMRSVYLIISDLEMSLIGFKFS